MIHILIVIVAALVIACPVTAQERADSTRSTAGVDDIGRDTDPMKPATFSVRDERIRVKDDVSLKTLHLPYR